MDAYWVLRKIWLHQLLKVLESSPDIERFSKTSYWIKVKFKKTGITEYWALDDSAFERKSSRIFRIPDDPLNDKKPKINCQFEINPYYEKDVFLKEHFMIKQSSLKSAGFVNLRIMVHNLAHALFEQGWHDIRYSEEILRDDFDKLKNSDLSTYQSSKIRFEIHKAKPAGMRTINHFIPISRAAFNHWKSMLKISYAIDQIIIGGLRDITRENIVKALNPICVLSPNYYRSILTQWFDVNNLRVIDFYPTSGSKALAVGLCGGKYFHNCELFQKPFKEMSKWCGLPESNFDDGGHYDFAFISRHQPLSREQAEIRISKYRDRADCLALMIEKPDWQYFIDEYKPKRVLRIAKGIFETANDDNYFLLIGQT